MEKGDLQGLIGPNGAGKTTVFNIVISVYAPTAGEILYTQKGQKPVSIGGRKPWQIARMGITRTFQNIRLFKHMSVIDNVMLSMHYGVKHNALGATLRLPSFQRDEARMNNEATSLLRIFGLDGKAHEFASSPGAVIIPTMVVLDRVYKRRA